MDAELSVTKIGKYEVLAELGRGGMGVVYRGEDKNIGREVAIKTLTAATPELRQRFLVEARSGVLNHQNIVTVYDFGEQDGNPYIVMEYLHGESLEKLLPRATMPLVDKLEIIRQVCNGLGYAHQKGVIHRDIKPANIMVPPDGHIKIVDFGIARLESSSGQTQTGAVIGTFHYISPERLRGRDSDGRADIWAAGVVLYQMLTGNLPFAGDDISALHKIVNESYPPLGQFLQDYPAALDQVMERALAKEPNERYDSAEEMAADLESINEVLKRERVGEVLAQIQVLLEQDKLATARPMLLDLQRLDPQNGSIKRLLREVQDRLARQQKFEQVRQTLTLAEEAVLNQRYVEAIDLYKQVERIDPAASGLQEKIAHVRGLKEKVDRIAALQQQARTAKQRNDLQAASQFIDQALTLDERNTDLRNDRAGILQEIERQAKEGSRRRLIQAGKDSLSARNFAEAVQSFRDALDIDPTDGEVQTLFQEATSRGEEERRRKVIEQIVSEIQDHLFRNNLDHALQLTVRALDRLPAEAALLRLKAEVEQKLHDDRARKLVESTSLRVQELFFADPQEAMSVVQAALLQMPGEERLLALQERVVDQLKKANLEGLRAQYVKQAQSLLGASQFDQAIAELEKARLDCGESSEILYLLDQAKSQKARHERDQTAAAALASAQTKLESEDLEGAIAILRPAAQQTGNAAVERLLRQTQERLDETARRMEAVIGRLRSLSETDPAQALQLLLSQPAAVQQHSQVRAIRADLEKSAEQQKALADAIRQADDRSRQKDLHGGMEILEAVGRAYGESAALTAAVAEYRQKQSAAANDMVGESINKARQAILAKNGPLALEELSRTRSVLDLAEPNCQADWNRLAQEASRVAKVRIDESGNMPVFVQKKSLGKAATAIIAVVGVLIVGAILLLVRSRSRGAEGGAGTTYMQLNASPFGEVVSITGSDGASVPLPTGSHLTPLRVAGLQEGSYTVVFKAGDGTSQTQKCDLSQDHLCTATFAPIGESQIDEILAGAK